jgi:hypothetical protein
MEIVAVGGSKKSKPIKANGGLWPEILNEMNGCQLTALIAQLKGYHLKEQSQFAGGADWRKLLFERNLW